MRVDSDFIVYLIFHFNRLSSIESSNDSDPYHFLVSWLSEKGLSNLINEFSIATWDKSEVSRGALTILVKGGEIIV